MALHRYWRVNCQTGGSGVFALSEVIFRSVAGGANIAVGGTAIASSTFSGSFIASNAFDNNINTAWASSANVAGEYIGYDFGLGNAVNVAQYALTARNDGSYGQAPNTGTLQYSDDNITWITGASFTAGAWGVAVSQVFTGVTGATTSIRSSQLTNVSVLGGTLAHIRLSQLGIISVQAPPIAAGVNSSQLMIVTVASVGRLVFTLTNAIKLPCWQPCTAYGTRALIVDLTQIRKEL